MRSIIRFMIFRQQQKPDVPVKRDEVTKLILSNYRGQRVNKQLIPHILKLVAAKFPTALGMEMKEITLKTQTKLGTLPPKSPQSFGLNKSQIVASCHKEVTSF